MKCIAGLICGVLFSTMMLGQSNPVSWSTEAIKKGNQVIVNFTAELAPSWNIYSQFLESDEGPVATSITFEVLDGLKPQGETVEMGDKKEAFDPLFEMKVAKFSKTVTFRQVFEITNESAEVVKGYITYMVCDEEKCLPPTDYDFSVNLP